MSVCGKGVGLCRVVVISMCWFSLAHLLQQLLEGVHAEVSSGKEGRDRYGGQYPTPAACRLHMDTASSAWLDVWS
jgi:hypothetical protein